MSKEKPDDDTWSVQKERGAFGQLLQRSIVAAWNDFRSSHVWERPYAFTIVAGQCAHYLGYAIATDQGLEQVAEKYESLGYRYKETMNSEFNREMLRTWLRWANPDDGWFYGDFPTRCNMDSALQRVVQMGVLNRDDTEVEEFCTEVLVSLLSNPDWQPWVGRVVVGFTFGDDPDTFLRTATRANPYPVVQRLWRETREGNEASGSITRPS